MPSSNISSPNIKQGEENLNSSLRTTPFFHFEDLRLQTSKFHLDISK